MSTSDAEPIDKLILTQPTFFYCTAIGSCLENGMVGVINPVNSATPVPRE